MVYRTINVRRKYEKKCIFSAIFDGTIKTAEQIIGLYNQGRPKDLSVEAGISNWWKFEENANDSVGSNHGTIQGATCVVR